MRRAPAAQGRLGALRTRALHAGRSQISSYSARLWRALRREHTLVSFAAPPEDDEEALSDAQVTQIFWNTLALECFCVALLYADSADDEPFSIFSLFVEGAIAAGICLVAIFVARRVFRWGNRRRHGGGCRWVRRLRAFVLGSPPPAPANSRAAADTLDKEQAARRRTVCAYRTRTALAWAFNLAIFLVAEVLVYAYGHSFGRRKTVAMLTSWAMASGQTWIFVEPLQVFLIVSLPFIFDRQAFHRFRTVFTELCG